MRCLAIAGGTASSHSCVGQGGIQPGLWADRAGVFRKGMQKAIILSLRCLKTGVGQGEMTDFQLLTKQLFFNGRIHDESSFAPII